MIGDHLMIPVSNQSQARAFYEQALGFVTIGTGRRAANLPDRTEMRVPGAALSVTLVEASETLPVGSLQGAILEVGDLTMAARHLSSRGIALVPQGARQFSIKDPDGNGWVIKQS
jgi:catechol 2,3-dioxygenase-like lactoylglutathione lyase family enzyme